MDVKRIRIEPKEIRDDGSIPRLAALLAEGYELLEYNAGGLFDTAILVQKPKAGRPRKTTGPTETKG